MFPILLPRSTLPERTRSPQGFLQRTFRSSFPFGSHRIHATITVRPSTGDNITFTSGLFRRDSESQDPYIHFLHSFHLGGHSVSVFLHFLFPFRQRRYAPTSGVVIWGKICTQDDGRVFYDRRMSLFSVVIFFFFRLLGV